jgi:hypothetical protein
MIAAPTGLRHARHPHPPPTGVVRGLRETARHFQVKSRWHATGHEATMTVWVDEFFARSCDHDRIECGVFAAPMVGFDM